MMKDNAVNKRYIVDETILPEAILKTAQTKELLAKKSWPDDQRSGQADWSQPQRVL